jgi:hypothetical protein
MVQPNETMALDGDESFHRPRLTMPKYAWIATYVNEASTNNEEEYNARLLHWPNGVRMPAYPHVCTADDAIVVLEIVTPLQKDMEVLAPYHWSKNRYALLGYKPKNFLPENIEGWRKPWDDADLDTPTDHTISKGYKRKYDNEQLHQVNSEQANKRRRTFKGRFV